MPNSREERKRKRIFEIEEILTKNPKIDNEDLVCMFIVNFHISRRIALEEIHAVRRYLDMSSKGGDNNG